jgi:hypothetical protein
MFARRRRPSFQAAGKSYYELKSVERRDAPFCSTFAVNGGTVYSVQSPVMHIMRSVQLAQNERLFFAWKNGTCRRRLEKGKVDEKTGRPFPFRFSALFKWNKKRGIRTVVIKQFYEKILHCSSVQDSFGSADYSNSCSCFLKKS